MCRRCGEPDRRGSSKVRRRRAKAMLEGRHNSLAGNGTITVCVWCWCLLGNRAGYLEVRHPDGTRERLRVERLELDRLGGLGTSYAMWNIAPACGDCNKARTIDGYVIPEGCQFGPEIAAERRAHLAGLAEVIDLEPFLESAPDDDDSVAGSAHDVSESIAL